MTTVGVPRVLKGTGGYLGWYLAYLRMFYQVPLRTKLNHEVGGAIHTSEVAVNGRSASPWAAAGTAAARVRSSKVYGLRSKGILLAKEGNGDLSEVSGEHHKAWRMCYMRCEHIFTPLTDPIIPVAPDPPSAPRGPAGRTGERRHHTQPDTQPTDKGRACGGRATNVQLG